MMGTNGNGEPEGADTDHEPWRTPEGKTITPARESTAHESRSTDLQAIRVIRTLVGGIVLVVLVLNLGGATQRIIDNPALAGLALTAVAQLIQKEDIEQLTKMFTSE